MNGLQLPSKQLAPNTSANALLQKAILPSSTILPSSALSRPPQLPPQQQQQQQPAADAEGSGGGDGKATNVDQLMDAAGMAGVDIGAEESALLSRPPPPAYGNQGVPMPQQQQHPQGDRSRKQTFIDPGVLAECVKKIAASFQLRTLEPDTIPLIALATRHRLAELLAGMREASAHRRNSSWGREVPFVEKVVDPKGKRTRDDEEASDASSDSDSDSDDSSSSHQKSKRRKLTSIQKVKVPAWDVTLLSSSDQLLSQLEKNDRENERKMRRERMVRDEEEAAEQVRLEEERRAAAVASGFEDSTDGDTMRGIKGEDGFLLTGGGTPGEEGKPGKGKKGTGPKVPKPKKKKEISQAAQARNMSEDVKKKLSDITATKQLGGRNYSWMTAAPSGSGAGGMSTPIGGAGGLSALPPPRFAPVAGTSTGSGVNSPNPTTPSTPTATSAALSALPPTLARLAQPLQLSLSNTPGATSLDDNSGFPPGAHVVGVSDLIFTLERERGAGVGRGSGRNVLGKVRAGFGGGRGKWVGGGQGPQ